MSLSQRSRSVIYDGLNRIIEDQEAVEELMSHFPARDLDEPVSKEFHRAETATLRAEMALSAAELRGEMAELATGLRGEMAELATGLRGEMAELRTDMRSEMAELRTDMRVGFAEIRTEMHRGFQRMTLSLAALMVSMSAVTAGLVTFAR
jgi:hypothetical protein